MPCEVLLDPQLLKGPYVLFYHHDTQTVLKVKCTFKKFS